jgi:hypothetical protein
MGSNDSDSGKVDGFPREEGDMSKRPKQQTSKREWVDPQIDIQPIQPQEPAQTHQEFSQSIASKMAESLGISSDLPDYESPNYSSARIHMQAMKEASETPIPREDYTSREILHPEISPLTKEEESIAESLPRFRPRDCVQCTTKRPTRSSYSRVYCTKGNTRYIRCGWKPCGYRYKQVEE